MVMTVRPSPARASASWISCSVSVSSADVASSNNRIGGFSVRMRWQSPHVAFPHPDSAEAAPAHLGLIPFGQRHDVIVIGNLEHAGRPAQPSALGGVDRAAIGDVAVINRVVRTESGILEAPRRLRDAGWSGLHPASP